MMNRYVIALSLVFLLLVTPTLAHGDEHSGEDQSQYGMMDDCLTNDNCHMAADMMGYGWFGMGTGGFLIGIIFWAAVIFLIVYLLDSLRNRGNPDDS